VASSISFPPERDEEREEQDKDIEQVFPLLLNDDLKGYQYRPSAKL
jgi:hypothetical protein